MSAYDINEVPAYRTSDGRVIKASDLTEITAYQTADGTLYVSKDEAKASLVSAAIRVIGSASAEVVNAAAANANTDEAQTARYAILYLAAVMQGNA